MAAGASAEAAGNASAAGRALQGSWGTSGHWQWPDGSSLQIGDADPGHAEVDVKASVLYSSFVIRVPNRQCNVASTSGGASATPAYEVGLHIHEVQVIEASVTVKALSRAHIFLGPSLADGYEIVLDPLGSQSTVARNGVVRYTYHTSLLGGGSTPQTFWISFTLSLGQGTLQVGRGAEPHVIGTEVLTLVDGAPPAYSPDGVLIWIATVAGEVGEWTVCRAGISLGGVEPAEHPRPVVKFVRGTGIRMLDCIPDTYDAVMLGSPMPFTLTPTDGSLSRTGPIKFMHGGRYHVCYKTDGDNTCSCNSQECRCSRDNSLCVGSSEPFGDCPNWDRTTSNTRMLFAQVRDHTPSFGKVSNSSRMMLS